METLLKAVKSTISTHLLDISWGQLVLLQGTGANVLDYFALEEYVALFRHRTV